ncbi:MAG TPA: hypothetical protein VFS65_00245 [Candidatus Saccharimonadales bacterium]|nr:hypothetical protein [Candidatus Saccharimonadales bacterium]
MSHKNETLTIEVTDTSEQAEQIEVLHTNSTERSIGGAAIESVIAQEADDGGLILKSIDDGDILYESSYTEPRDQ